MRLESIEEKYPNCMIEVTDDNKAFIHVGGAYPLILNIDTPDPAPARLPEPPAPATCPECGASGEYTPMYRFTDWENDRGDCLGSLADCRVIFDAAVKDDPEGRFSIYDVSECLACGMRKDEGVIYNTNCPTYANGDEPPAPARPRLPRCHFCGKYAGVIYTDLEGHPADPTDCEAVLACFGCADAPEVEAAKATLARPWTCAGMIEAERARLEDKEVKAMY